MIDKLPVELWLKILELACTDGGATACALSLVSKSIRALTDPIRFYTVALDELERVVAFHRVLEKKPPCRRRVKHLYIALLDAPMLSWVYTGPPRAGGRRPSTLARDERRSPRQAKQRPWGTTVAETLPRIFDMVAPSLKTLTLLIAPFAGIPPIVPYLPALTEFTFHGTEDAVSQEDRVLFPSLKRLHLVCVGHSNPRVDSCLAQIRKYAPSLSHLRLSGLPPSSAFPQKLQRALQLPCVVSPRLRPADMTYGSDVSIDDMPFLSHILVQPESPPALAAMLNDYCLSYSRMMDNLAYIAAAEPRVSVLKARKQAPVWETKEEARDNWLAAVEGVSAWWESAEEKQQQVRSIAQGIRDGYRGPHQLLAYSVRGNFKLFGGGIGLHFAFVFVPSAVRRRWLYLLICLFMGLCISVGWL